MKFGPIEGVFNVRDGGYGRVMLDIPNRFLNGIRLGARDRDASDAIARLHAMVFNGSLPLWCSQHREVYTVEVPVGTSDDQIKQLVALIKSNQK